MQQVLLRVIDTRSIDSFQKELNALLADGTMILRDIDVQQLTYGDCTPTPCLDPHTFFVMAILQSVPSDGTNTTPAASKVARQIAEYAKTVSQFRRNQDDAKDGDRERGEVPPVGGAGRDSGPGEGAGAVADQPGGEAAPG